MSDTDLIKDKIDIVDLVSEYVQLKPAGINHKGRCPFHNEKTPSFMVNRERQIFKCFGCSKGGDIFTFVQEMEGMEFPEALKYLANKAGVQLSDRRSEVDSSQKNRLKDINQSASNFFHKFLLQMPASESARAYLRKRELTEKTIEEWQIGFISDQWDLLTKYLLKKGFGIDDLVASGLTIKRDGADSNTGHGFYDRFRGRIMFPIWDAHDNVAGFTGRVLVETEHSGGKYVNTPQTLVYDKSRIIFGLNKAKTEIKAKNLSVMVEGQMDVIACHQAGMKNVVATSGTALTEQQIKLLQRYSNNLNMAFDADQAGIAAAKRGIDLALIAGMNVKVIQIPDGAGKDPDECLKKNKDVWFKSVYEARDIMSWYFERAFSNKNINDPKQKQEIANALLPEISKIIYAVEKDYWLQRLSNDLKVEISVLREDMLRIKDGNLRNKEQGIRNKDNMPVSVLEPVINEKNDRLSVLIERFLELILRFPDLPYNPSFFWPISNHANVLYESLKKVYNNNEVVDINNLRNFCATNNQQNIVDILLLKGEKDFFGISVKEAEEEMRILVFEIKGVWLKSERQRLQKEIEIAEKNGDSEKLSLLLEKFNQLK